MFDYSFIDMLIDLFALVGVACVFVFVLFGIEAGMNGMRHVRRLTPRRQRGVGRRG